LIPKWKGGSGERFFKRLNFRVARTSVEFYQVGKERKLTRWRCSEFSAGTSRQAFGPQAEQEKSGATCFTMVQRNADYEKIRTSGVLETRIAWMISRIFAHARLTGRALSRS